MPVGAPARQGATRRAQGPHVATHLEQLQDDLWCDGELRQRRLRPSRGSDLLAAQVVVEILANLLQHGGGDLQRSRGQQQAASNREDCAHATHVWQPYFPLLRLREVGYTKRRG